MRPPCVCASIQHLIYFDQVHDAGAVNLVDSWGTWDSGRLGHSFQVPQLVTTEWEFEAVGLLESLCSFLSVEVPLAQMSHLALILVSIIKQLHPCWVAPVISCLPALRVELHPGCSVFCSEASTWPDTWRSQHLWHPENCSFNKETQSRVGLQDFLLW